MRPFLTRSADAIMAKTDLVGWTRGTCPLCAGEPDFAVITPAADRILICGRCSARWHFHQITCPFCPMQDESRMTSFASRDGQYRLYACDVCRKVFEGVRCAAGVPTGDAGGGRRRDAPARRRRDAEGLQVALGQAVPRWAAIQQGYKINRLLLRLLFLPWRRSTTPCRTSS